MSDLLVKYLKRFTNLGPFGLTIVFFGSILYTISFLIFGPNSASFGFLLGILPATIAFNTVIRNENTEPYETSFNMIFWTITVIFFIATLMYTYFAIPLNLPFGNIWIFTFVLITNYSIALKSAL